MPNSYWWGDWNPKSREHDATPRMSLEFEAWRNQFPRNNIIELAPTDWEGTVWFQVRNIDSGYDEHNRLYLILTIRFAEGESRQQMRWEEKEYRIKVVYPEQYPSQAPKSYLAGESLYMWSTPHVYADGQLCLFNPSDGRNRGWNPSKHNGATIALWSVQWIRAHKHYQRTNRWPGEDGHS